MEKALRSIGREDIVDQCIFNVELVTDDLEKAAAKMQLEAQHPAADMTTIEEQHSVLRRNTSLDVSFDEQDLMKVHYIYHIDHVDIINSMLNINSFLLLPVITHCAADERLEGNNSRSNSARTASAFRNDMHPQRSGSISLRFAFPFQTNNQPINSIPTIACC